MNSGVFPHDFDKKILPEAGILGFVILTGYLTGCIETLIINVPITRDS